MNKLISLLLVSFAATSVYAADDCASRAAEKKLALSLIHISEPTRPY